MARTHHSLHCLRAIIRAQDFGVTRAAVQSRYFSLLSTELGGLKSAFFDALMSQQLGNLPQGFGLFSLLDRKRFDLACQVFFFEVLVAFNWIYKLRLCCSAKEKLRFVVFVLQRAPSQGCAALNLPHELLEGLDLHF